MTEAKLVIIINVSRLNQWVSKFQALESYFQIKYYV